MVSMTGTVRFGLAPAPPATATATAASVIAPNILTPRAQPPPMDTTSTLRQP